MSILGMDDDAQQTGAGVDSQSGADPSQISFGNISGVFHLIQQRFGFLFSLGVQHGNPGACGRQMLVNGGHQLF